MNQAIKTHFKPIGSGTDAPVVEDEYKPEDENDPVEKVFAKHLKNKLKNNKLPIKKT
jgi:hypothetical protein